MDPGDIVEAFSEIDKGYSLGLWQLVELIDKSFNRERWEAELFLGPATRDGLHKAFLDAMDRGHAEFFISVDHKTRLPVVGKYMSIRTLLGLKRVGWPYIAEGKSA